MLLLRETQINSPNFKYLNKGLIAVLAPLTFSKLQFWPPKKKTTKPPPQFCIYGSFGPQGQF